MPATRSRTEHWRESLDRVLERGGALEISIDRSTPDGSAQGGAPAAAGADLVWRVRLLAIEKDRLVVEPPAAFGASIKFAPGVPLIGAMTVGQNRWMFHTRTLGHLPGHGSHARDGLLTIALPERVERCSRRSFFRISTADLRLPEVQCWPLLDPSSVVPAEAANRDAIRQSMAGAPGGGDRAAISPLLLPDAGPSFTARLLNISGGGLGLLVDQNDSAVATSRSYVWLRLDLKPEIAVPVAVTARIAHSHLDSSQCVYLGMAFDGVHDPEHRRFVVELLTDYCRRLQARGVPEARAA